VPVNGNGPNWVCLQFHILSKARVRGCNFRVASAAGGWGRKTRPGASRSPGRCYSYFREGTFNAEPVLVTQLKLHCFFAGATTCA